MAFNNKEKTDAWAKFLTRDITGKNLKPFEYQGQPWSQEGAVVGVSYAGADTKIKDMQGGICLCRVSNGIERKYAVMRTVAVQQGEVKAYPLSMHNLLEDGKSEYKKKLAEMIEQFNISEEQKMLLKEQARNQA
ncbi:MAG: hypothetical protein KGH61_04595 [Candidatus Micrarchaeota archaeon]|nr:hypothetical protein [Candidatus Micrarchaeota archaeon]MDE1848196.1 hypothetical protein [Candidatus Micrarchaeota archaeon]MDE1864844.1 hypothetical protein [Candidatus Micrarchaeota archaeon]